MQEFIPSRKRGRISGLVTAFVPVGLLLGSVSGAFLIPTIGWRGVCLSSLPICAFVLLVRAWVPESPQWLMQQGRREEARRSLAWALQADPEDLVLPPATPAQPAPRWLDILRYPRSLAVSCLGNLGAQTGTYGLSLWLPTLLILILHVSAAQAASMMIAFSLSGLVGRVMFSYLADAIGRRASGGLFGLGGGALVIAAAMFHDSTMGGGSTFWLILVVAYLFVDGGFAIVGPYSAEVWLVRLKTTGMGAAYGFGGIGKLIGPLGLALIVGSSNVVKPGASVSEIVPAFVYLGSWFFLSGAVYLLLGPETRGMTQTAVEDALAGQLHRQAPASNSARSG